jgi:hypothetical protein
MCCPFCSEKPKVYDPLVSACKRIAELERELAEARAKAERWEYGTEHGLPWRNIHSMTIWGGQQWHYHIDGISVMFSTADEAIDAERKP